MRQTQIFSGSSHPALVESICNRLGQQPAKAELGKFSNGETKVQLNTSIRDQDVFIVQSGSSHINDSVMELLVMVSACKGGSAKSITAVLPYFPYSRQSKKKSHRGAITARMLANLLDVAGVDHVITIDLHASQMQGFFKCPVDNLVAEPLLSHWIKRHVRDWQNAVVVSKNPGGTKRVTSLADALKLSFGIIMTDRYRPGSPNRSMDASIMYESGILEKKVSASSPFSESKVKTEDHDLPARPFSRLSRVAEKDMDSAGCSTYSYNRPNDHQVAQDLRLSRAQTAPSTFQDDGSSSEDDELDKPSREIIRGRLVHGHIVDEDQPSPAASAFSARTAPTHRRRGSDDENNSENMTSSFLSTASSKAGLDQGLGGSGDAGASSDEEEENLKNPDLESTVTLVGNVKDKIVFIVDDMIDKSASWIAAAETVVKRGGATEVYCFATHGIFGGDCLTEMEECDCIHKIIVTDSFPISQLKARVSSKLCVLDVSALLTEAIRRNHHGESISQLFLHYD